MSSRSEFASVYELINQSINQSSQFNVDQTATELTRPEMAEDTTMAEDTIQVLASTPPTLGTDAEATFNFVGPTKVPHCGANSSLGPARGNAGAYRRRETWMPPTRWMPSTWQ
jgi:hypothetical protein